MNCWNEWSKLLFENRFWSQIVAWHWLINCCLVSGLRGKKPIRRSGKKLPTFCVFCKVIVFFINIFSTYFSSTNFQRIFHQDFFIAFFINSFSTYFSSTNFQFLFHEDFFFVFFVIIFPSTFSTTFLASIAFLFLFWIKY